MRDTGGRRGFTFVELLIVIVVLGALTAMGLPQFNRTIRQRRIIAASGAVAQDVEAAFSLAARQRRPIRLTYNTSAGELEVADRATPSTVYRRRPLGGTSEYRLDAVSLSSATIDLFPNGVGSSGFTVTLTNGPFTRQVVVTRTGLTRIVVP